MVLPEAIAVEARREAGVGTIPYRLTFVRESERGAREPNAINHHSSMSGVCSELAEAQNEFLPVIKYRVLGLAVTM